MKNGTKRRRENKARKAREAKFAAFPSFDNEKYDGHCVVCGNLLCRGDCEEAKCVLEDEADRGST